MYKNAILYFNFPKSIPTPPPSPYLVRIQDSEFSQNFVPHPLRGNVGEKQRAAPTYQPNLCSYSGHQKCSCYYMELPHTNIHPSNTPLIMRF